MRMSAGQKRVRLILGLGALWPLWGCGPKAAQTTAAGSLETFVADAKRQNLPEPQSEGSLWVDGGRRSNLFRDFKAREVNDILTIRVRETTAATTSADASNARSAEASAGFESLLGAERLIKELPSALSGQSSSTFKGEGSTNRNSTLVTTISARVSDVLPNGNLVVEGVREIRLNNENQIVYLSGLVRPEDISSGNIVLSSAVAQMEVKLIGRGTVSQPLKPGWLYKILNGILPF